MLSCDIHPSMQKHYFLKQQGLDSNPYSRSKSLEKSALQYLAKLKNEGQSPLLSSQESDVVDTAPVPGAKQGQTSDIDPDKFQPECFDKCPMAQNNSSTFPSPLLNNISSPDKYVGYADLPNQIHRYCVMNGFDFNLMVIGESGLGKSTFVNNLFMTDVYVPTKYTDKTPPMIAQTMDIRYSSVTLTENGFPLRLTVIDTPGFGDCINNSSCFDKILNYVNGRYEEYMKWESSSQRSPCKDKRVHCCIYFISPSGHRLKPLDLHLLKKLHDKLNIIPVIARSDALSPDDLTQFKKRVIDDMKINGIRTYDFPEISYRKDEEKDVIKSYIAKAPFAIVSSNVTSELNGKQVRCRKYPWGVCEVENNQHSDFTPLRDLLLRTCTGHLIETTHKQFYENFRATNLCEAAGIGQEKSDLSPLEAIETERQVQSARLDSTRKELEATYSKRQEECKKKLEEQEKANSTRLALEEVELNRLRQLSITSTSPELNTSQPVAHPKVEEKKKDKRKRLF